MVWKKGGFFDKIDQFDGPSSELGPFLRTDSKKKKNQVEEGVACSHGTLISRPPCLCNPTLFG